MKRFSAIICICLCLVIGGVYASWLYTGTTVTTPDPVSISTAIDTKSQNGNAGAITADSTLAFKVDNAGGDVTTDDNYYKAVLNNEGKIDIKFTPAQGSPTYYVNGPAMTLTLTVGRTVYSQLTDDTTDDVVVLGVKDATNDGGKTRIVLKTPEVGATQATINADKQIGSYTNTAGADEDPVYVWSITSAQIMSLLEFCEGEDVWLDTAARHDRFAGDLSNSVITIEVAAVAEPTAA